eukprot:XP_025007490.1 uncharacterized protein LOC112532615 isoform X1 [Gallus gallus]
MKTDRIFVQKGDSYKHHMSILCCLFFCAVAAVQSDVSNCLHPNEQLVLQSSSSEESCLLTQEKMMHKEITESHNSRGCEGPPGIIESSHLQSRPPPAGCRGTEVRLSGLDFPGSSFLPFLKTGVTSAVLRSSGTSSVLQDLSKMTESDSAVTSAISPSMCGCIPPVTFYRKKVWHDTVALHSFKALRAQYGYRCPECFTSFTQLVMGRLGTVKNIIFFQKALKTCWKGDTSYGSFAGNSDVRDM